MTKTKTKLQLLALFTLATGSATAFAGTPRTLAGGRPACGNTMTKGGRHHDTACEQAEQEAELSEMMLESTAAQITRGLTTLLAVSHDEDVAVAAPRQLANGAPACGNTNSKSSCTMDEPAPVAKVAVVVPERSDLRTRERLASRSRSSRPTVATKGKR